MGKARSRDSLAGLGDDGVLSVTVDLATSEGTRELMNQAFERFGRVDILLNNVNATDPRMGEFSTVTDAQFLASCDLHFMSTARACPAVLPSMLKQGLRSRWSGARAA
ncbi:MAG: SDR family NAD(P)-dependent oxidoreductase [Novosphingobium sp.]